MAAILVPSPEDVYHPEWLAFEEATGGRMAFGSDVEQNRMIFDQTGRDLAEKWPSLDDQLNTTDQTIEPEGFKIRIYTPKDSDVIKAALPVMVYFHGGGFISGDLYTEHPHCRILAAKTPCTVVSVDYPLAPKFKMDAIIQAALRAVEWTKSEYPSAPLLLAGGSAGATLALQTATHYALKGDTSTVSGLILMQPTCSPTSVTPYTGPHSDRHTSFQEKAEGAPFLNTASCRAVVETPQMSITSPAHFILVADRLPPLPRSYIVTAEHDPTRDDGKVLAMRLREETDLGEEGVREDFYVGMPHWFHWFPNVPSAHVMMEKTVAGTQWVLGGLK